MSLAAKLDAAVHRCDKRPVSVLVLLFVSVLALQSVSVLALQFVSVLVFIVSFRAGFTVC